MALVSLTYTNKSKQTCFLYPTSHPQELVYSFTLTFVISHLEKMHMEWHRGTWSPAKVCFFNVWLYLFYPYLLSNYFMNLPPGEECRAGIQWPKSGICLYYWLKFTVGDYKHCKKELKNLLLTSKATGPIVGFGTSSINLWILLPGGYSVMTVPLTSLKNERICLYSIKQMYTQ